LQEWPEIAPTTTAEISKDKPYQTLAEFVDNTTQAKRTKENDNNIIEIDLQNKVDMAKNVKIKKTTNSQKIKKKKTTKNTMVKNQLLSNAQRMLP
jgi:hypothetical protein